MLESGRSAGVTCRGRLPQDASLPTGDRQMKRADAGGNCRVGNGRRPTASQGGDSDEQLWTLQAHAQRATLCASHPPLYFDTDQGLWPVLSGAAPAQLNLLLQAPPCRHRACATMPGGPANAGGDNAAAAGAGASAGTGAPNLWPATILAPTLLREVPVCKTSHPHGCSSTQPEPWAGGWGRSWRAGARRGRRPGAAGCDGLSELNHRTPAWSLGCWAPMPRPVQESRRTFAERLGHWADNGFNELPRGSGLRVSLDAALERLDQLSALRWAVALQPKATADPHRRVVRFNHWASDQRCASVGGRLRRVSWCPRIYLPSHQYELCACPPAYVAAVDFRQWGPHARLRQRRPALAPGRPTHQHRAGVSAVWEGARALRTLVAQLEGRERAASDGRACRRYMPPCGPTSSRALNWLQFLRARGLCGVLTEATWAWANAADHWPTSG